MNGIVRVALQLETPIALSSPLHLDALLTAVHPSMYNHGHQPTRQDTDSNAIVNAPLPLYSVRSTNTPDYDWVWAASAAEFPEAAQVKEDAITKKWTGEDINQFQLMLATATGALRFRFVRFPVIITPEIHFFCAPKDLGQLKRLLKRVQSVGAMRRSGYGVVSGWSIEPVQMHWHEVIVNDGFARRNLPSSFGAGEDVSINTHPPYWHKAAVTQGTSVGSRIELNNGLVFV